MLHRPQLWWPIGPQRHSGIDRGRGGGSVPCFIAGDDSYLDMQDDFYNASSDEDRSSSACMSCIAIVRPNAGPARNTSNVLLSLSVPPL